MTLDNKLKNKFKRISGTEGGRAGHRLEDATDRGVDDDTDAMGMMERGGRNRG